ncbi:AraC family transcriptional regulator [Streptomyces tubbatahanensis]|uniref:AraC family transcriptional regulator n=1 Tax=Streptomyces tubbatahanensis TaxID=2923272 RepID=A0ABY3XR17_9ACTN|nr:AraC family transcriptional regulator [Streptomyces tubbatahanensis]UNS96840.1 AraC family transcriptional regulator [Streptomyces tubbatahanensis]
MGECARREVSDGTAAGDWVRYWRAPGQPVEAMRAHFTGHVFHRHSHDAYSFAVTETGAQRFHCRGGRHTSGAGMVMAFNPDDPHDGESAVEQGFTYRIVHLGPGLVRSVLTDAAGRDAPMPLFPQPVREDPVLRRALLRLNAAVSAGAAAGALARDERLTDAVLAMVRRGAHSPARVTEARAGTAAVRRARRLLEDDWAGEVPAERLARAAGCSRFALYRAFRAEMGMPPSDYQRQLRLRAARRMLAGGATAAEAAAGCGFADQAHLHRWFVRCYGITPGAYTRAA